MAKTSTSPDRRTLRFGSAQEVLAEADRIAAAERGGTLRRTGNWTAGQTFGHLATWIDFAYDGYPPDLRPPWLLKVIFKLFLKKRFMRGPLPSGVKIRGIKGGTLGTEPLSLEDGLVRLRRSWDRLAATPPPKPNILLGPMTHEEWQQMHRRHAELHMGFLHPL